MDADVIQTINDTIQFVKDHPLIAGAVASVVTASESLPFIKKLESNGLVQLLGNVFKFITKKKGA